MKTTSLAIVIACFLALFAHGEESLLLPVLGTEWTRVADSTPANPSPPVVEAETGHFYQFKVQIHDNDKTKTKGKAKDRSNSTSVFHSTDPKDFGTEGKYPEAMHLVANLPVEVTDVIKRDGQWYVIGKRPMIKGGQETRLTWKSIGPVALNARHSSTDKIRVALYDDAGSMGKGVPSCQAQLGPLPGIDLTTLNADGIRAGLGGYDVVIFSGGSGSRQASTIGLAGREQVRRFVEAGGGYVGICAGSYLACTGFTWGVQILNAKTPSPLWERGHADLKIETTKTGQELLGLPADATVIYHNGPILTPGLRKDLPEYEPLVFFRTEVSKTPKQAGLQVNTPAMARGTYGKGHVLVSSPHPEQTAGMEHWVEHAVRAVAPALDRPADAKP